MDITFVSGIWHSGTSLIARILLENGYDTCSRVNGAYDSQEIWFNFLRDKCLKKLTKGEKINFKQLRDVIIQELKNTKLTETYKDNNTKRGNNKYFVKLPGFIFCTDVLFEAFPNAKLLNITRNGLDVAMSEIQIDSNNPFHMASYNPYKKNNMPKEDGYIARVIRWNNLVKYQKKNFKNKNNNNILDIRYEDICTNYNSEIKKISNFLNDDTINKQTLIIEGKINKYKTLPNNKINELATYCKNGLALYNYKIN